MEEIADRVWVARHQHEEIPNGVNVGVVGGSRGLLVIDTLWSVEVASELAARLPGEVVAVVNTHDHWDHVLGNPAFAAPTYAHDSLTSDHPFSSVSGIDLGDRFVELLHPGRGHTACDIVARLDDVLFVGDLVEQGAPPAYGDDSWPLEWPAALDLLADLIGPSTVVVPGHGTTVDQEFVAEQRASLGVVAETIRDLASRGVPADEALRSAAWPFPAGALEHAVRRGYAQLPLTARRLPLV